MRLLIMAAAIMLAASPAVAATNAVTSFTGGLLFDRFDDDVDTIGWSFGTANHISVTALGWYVDPSFTALTADRQVGIWTTTGTLLGSTTLTAGVRTEGNWRFAAVTPFTLSAGTYVIGGTDVDDDDEYITGVDDLVMAPGINFLGAARNGSNGFSFPSRASSSVGRFGPSFTFAPATGAVPEPASWAMLIAGFGLVGAAARRRRVAIVA